VLEIELKSTVDDVDLRCRALEAAGARLTFAGRLEDRRYDSPSRAMAQRDHVLRVRVYRDGAGARAELGWKGPTRYEDGFKLREELALQVVDPDTLQAILERMELTVSAAIDREIRQYDLAGTIIRFERYPRMDALVEVEGTREGIERAIEALGLPREGFTADRLPHFVRRYEERTGQRAAICDAQLAGTAAFGADHA
jgi:adenylate cyclase, class 2